MGRQWPAAGLGALSVAVNAWDLLKEVAIVFITSTIVGESESRLVVSSSLQPHGSLQTRILGVGSLSLLQGIFPSQGSNSGLPHCRWILYHLSHKGNTIVWPQVNNREGTRPHPSTENWIKDLLNMASPIRTSFLYQEAFISLLSFSIRGQTD